MARRIAVALIDGEHYFPVIEAALETIAADPDYKLAGAVFIGGTEKVMDSAGLGGFIVPVIIDPDPNRGIDQAVARFKPSVFIDLSDEPVVGYRERFKFACRILAHNISYRGSDFLFEPPTFLDVVHKPSISIIGTGKRTGKTAVSAFICRELKSEGYDPIVVAMGRGGPAAPEVIYGGEIELAPEYLLEKSRQGKHAASDHYEDALMSRITTIGCRRCGGGMAGEVFVSNVIDGAKVADGLSEKMIVFEGSGAALPPVRTDLSVLIAGAGQPEEYITGYFGPYRIGLSDLVILTMCEEPLASAHKIKRLAAGIKALKPGIKVVQTVFRPKPLNDVSGKRVFVATTAPASVGQVITGYLGTEFGCEVVGISHHLSNRPLLREDLAAAAEHDVVMTELKAAGVDVVTEYGVSGGKDVVYMDNCPVTVGGDGDVKELLIEAAVEARRRFVAGEEMK